MSWKKYADTQREVLIPFTASPVAVHSAPRQLPFGSAKRSFETIASAVEELLKAVGGC
jgi:hypothetical protein